MSITILPGQPMDPSGQLFGSSQQPAAVPAPVAPPATAAVPAAAPVGVAVAEQPLVPSQLPPNAGAPWGVAPGTGSDDSPRRSLPGRMVALIVVAALVIVGAAYFFLFHKKTATTPLLVAPPAAATHPAAAPKVATSKPKRRASNKAGHHKSSKPESRPETVVATPVHHASHAAKAQHSATTAVSTATTAADANKVFAVLPTQLTGWNQVGHMSVAGSKVIAASAKQNKKVSECIGAHVPTVAGAAHSTDFTTGSFVESGELDVFKSDAAAQADIALTKNPKFAHCISASVLADVRPLANVGVAQITDVRTTTLHLKGIADAAGVRLDFIVEANGNATPCRVDELSSAVGNKVVDLLSIGIGKAQAVSFTTGVLKAMAGAA